MLPVPDQLRKDYKYQLFHVVKDALTTPEIEVFHILERIYGAARTHTDLAAQRISRGIARPEAQHPPNDKRVYTGNTSADNEDGKKGREYWRSTILSTVFKYPNILTTCLQHQIDKDLATGQINDALYKELFSFVSDDEFNGNRKLWTAFRDETLNKLDLNTAKTASEKYVNAANISEPGKSYLKKALSEGITEAAYNNFKRINKISSTDFFNHWAAGKFSHPVPLFHSEQDAREMASFLTDCIWYSAETYSEYTKAKAKEAGSKLAERIIAHEKDLWITPEQLAAEKEAAGKLKAKIAADKAEIAKKKRDALEAEAIERAQKESERYATFMAEPQPYHYTEDAGKVAYGISHLTGTSISKNTQRVLNILSHAGELLDIRDESVKQLGDILLSANNILALSRACGLENQVKSLKKGTTSLKEDYRHLCVLYDTSQAVHEIVDGLMQDHNGILLLGTLTRDEVRCKNYASGTAKPLEELATANEKYTLAHDVIKEYASEEIHELETSGDKDALDAKKAKEELDRKITECEDHRRHLETEIRQALQGKKRGIENHHIAAGETAEKKIELPAQWLVAMQEDTHVDEEHRKARSFHAEPSPKGDKYISICNDRYPWYKIDIKLNSPNFDETIKTLREQCYHFHINMQTQKDMIRKYGFLIGNDNEKIYHPEYGIEVRLPESDEADSNPYLFNKKFAESLDEAKEKYEARFFQQQAILRSAMRSAITITPKKGGITFEHPAFGLVTLNGRGYFSNDDFVTLQDLINKTIAQPAAEPEKSDASAEQKAPVVTPASVWPPQSGQTVFFFDTNTMNMLATPRETPTGKEERTWLDLIKCTARLPNVKVIIPSVIADWELRGQIPRYDAQGRIEGYDQANENFRKKYHFLNHITTPVDKLLRSASHVQLTDDGQYIVKPGDNPNIIIFNTPADRTEVYDTVKSIMQGPPQEQVSRLEKEIYHSNKGEEAIDRIVARLPYQVSATVVSDDMRYFKHAKRTTERGMPVGQASTLCYLDAEFSAHAPALRKYLGETDALTVFRLNNDITTHRKSIGADAFLPEHCEAGLFQGPDLKAENVYGIINKGVDEYQLQQEQRKINGGNGNGGTYDGNGTYTKWSQSGLRNIIEPESISRKNRNASTQDRGII